MAKSAAPGSMELSQALERGVGLHQRGQLADAERIYRQILNKRSDHFEARHLLGLLRYQQGRNREALDLIGAALKLRPDSVVALSNYGLALEMAGRYEEALVSFDRALALRPDYAEAHNNRGNVLSALKRSEDALASYDRALTLQPGYAEAHNNRGIALSSLARHEEALASFERALAIGPQYAQALYNRGNALSSLARHDEALASYDRALELESDYAEAHYNRGNVLSTLERHGDALASYDRALALKPDHAEAIGGRGNALHALARRDEALASYDRALALKPDDAETHYNRGGAAQGLDRHEEALASFDRALALKPDYPEALYARGQSLHAMNRWHDAIVSYKRALALKPDYAEAAFAACMAQLPILYADATEITERRTAYAARLQALCDNATMLAADLVKGVGTTQPFFLAYQGENDRDLQARYGAFVCRLMAERYPPAAMPSPPAAHEPIRVGIVSGYFRQHSNWKIPIKGWLENLDRQRFRVFGYHTGAQTDGATEATASLCERLVQAPLPIEGWRGAIAADAPHVLIYPEVGMDPVAARLAAQRLAPVQCNSWGHPDTSGFPTLDYYFSSDLMEPPDGDAHYTERLVRLPNLSVYCESIEAPRIPLDRQELGLRAGATVFWCGQSLYKYLPQFDSVFPRIARQVPGCQFAFIQYQRGPAITDLFRQRLVRAFAAFGLQADDYCVFLPRLDPQRFIAAIGQCDIVLDSIGWSGCNSTLESLAHNLPIVTLPSMLMRGRHTLAILHMMGVTETIAPTVDDYVSVAARLAHDATWRDGVMGRIAANKHRLYHDRACITALAEFLDRVARTPRP
jgi:protein O-GlcNAc transferase